MSNSEVVVTLASARRASEEKLASFDRESAKNRISALVQTLRHFDVKTIEGRDDWKANSFVALINDTLSDIFGENSTEYRKYAVLSFDTLPAPEGTECPVQDVQQGYQKGINTAVRRLRALHDSLIKKEEAKEPVSQIGTTDDSTGREKISLVTLRSRLKKSHLPSETTEPTDSTRARFVKPRRKPDVVAEDVPDKPFGHISLGEGIGEVDGRGCVDNSEKNEEDPVNPGAMVPNQAGTAEQKDDLVLEFREAMGKILKTRDAEEGSNRGDESVAAPIQKGNQPFATESRRADRNQRHEEPVTGPSDESPKTIAPSSITADDPQQNAFTTREQAGPPVQGTANLQTQIKEIMSRIDDLRSFDVTTITKRYDPRIQKLVKSVNVTIADIFGHNTRDYWDHSLTSFEAAHAALGTLASSAMELRNSYGTAIDKAVKKLTAIAESLTSRLNDPASGKSSEGWVNPSRDREQYAIVPERRVESPARKPLFSASEFAEEDGKERLSERRTFRTIEVEQEPFGRKKGQGQPISARTAESHRTSTEASSREVVHSFFEEFFVEKDLTAADRLLADHYTFHGSHFPDLSGGKEDLKSLQSSYFSAIPDSQFTVHEHIVEGNKVVTRWTAQGTHKKNFPNIPATGRSFSVTGITISHVSEGKIIEEWQDWDRLGFLQQLGAAPTVRNRSPRSTK
jgi:steroid delta-isomerase-like uncharacterized protein